MLLKEVIVYLHENHMKNIRALYWHTEESFNVTPPAFMQYANTNLSPRQIVREGWKCLPSPSHNAH